MQCQASVERRESGRRSYTRRILRCDWSGSERVVTPGCSPRNRIESLWNNPVPGLEQHNTRVGAIQSGVGARRLSKWAIRGTCSGQRRPTLVNPTTLGVGTRVRQRQSRAEPAIHDEQSTLVVIARTTVVKRD